MCSPRAQREVCHLCADGLSCNIVAKGCASTGNSNAAHALLPPCLPLLFNVQKRTHAQLLFMGMSSLLMHHTP